MDATNRKTKSVRNEFKRYRSERVQKILLYTETTLIHAATYLPCIIIKICTEYRENHVHRTYAPENKRYGTWKQKVCEHAPPKVMPDNQINQRSDSCRSVFISETRDRCRFRDTTLQNVVREQPRVDFIWKN